MGGWTAGSGVGVSLTAVAVGVTVVKGVLKLRSLCFQSPR